MTGNLPVEERGGKLGGRREGGGITAVIPKRSRGVTFTQIVILLKGRRNRIGEKSGRKTLCTEGGKKGERKGTGHFPFSPKKRVSAPFPASKKNLHRHFPVQILSEKRGGQRTTKEGGGGEESWAPTIPEKTALLHFQNNSGRRGERLRARGIGENGEGKSPREKTTTILHRKEINYGIITSPALLGSADHKPDTRGSSAQGC